MNSVNGIPFPDSYWLASRRYGVEDKPLTQDIDTDTLIIGGGFTGLSSAYHLARKGQRFALVEAYDFGWGASGRTGGMLPPRYKKGFSCIAKLYGNETAVWLHALILEAIDTVEQIVSSEAIDCDFARTGQITAAHSAEALSGLQADYEWARTVIQDTGATILNQDEVREEIGGGNYPGGWLDQRGAGIHPLNYSWGLAEKLRQQGAELYNRTKVLGLKETADGILVETDGGRISAKRVIIATNAYTDTVHFAPGELENRIVAVASSIVATAPLGAIADQMVKNRRMIADTRRIMSYFRVSPDNRLIFGGRGDLTGRKDSPEVYQEIEKRMQETFPGIDFKVEYRWFGKVAVSTDDFPHIGKLSDRVIYAMGYGGRGVALANLLGKYAAALAAGENIQLGPMTDNPFAKFPFHAFRMLGMQLVAGWWRYLDNRDEKTLRS